MRAQRLTVLLLAVFLPAALPAGGKLRLRPPVTVDHDQSPITQPRKQNVSEIYAIVYNSWLRHLSPAYKAARAADPGALNVNAWDQLPASSWFTNRIGLKPMSFEEIETGLNAGGKPPQPGTWTVTGIEDEGYTPKIYVKDPAGNSYLVKFDLPTALERNSAAERICTLIMYASGFNVPHNSIAYFRRADLKLGEGAKYTDSIGKKQPLTLPIFEAMLQKLKSMPDGKYRGLASMLVKGTGIGKFVYQGRREDDANDTIPHELRRELRGFRVIASWINHVDVGDKNTYDAFVVGQDKRGYVQHYLLDFGSTMGSGDFVNGPFRVGHEYIFDGSSMGKSLVSFGAYRRPWDVQGRILYPEVGYFQADIFEPATWKPNYPNLAFEQMDDSDGYWGAKIVTAFTDDTILRLAQAGEYTRSAVTQHIADVLKKRRDAIGRYWFDRVTPLEEFSLSQSGSGYLLSFRDLAAERGISRGEDRTYRFRLENADGQKMTAEQDTQPGVRTIDLPADVLSKAHKPDNKPDRFGRISAVRLLIQARDPVSPPALPVEVILGYTGGNSQLEVLGWYHAPHK